MIRNDVVRTERNAARHLTCEDAAHEGHVVPNLPVNHNSGIP